MFLFQWTSKSYLCPKVDISKDTPQFLILLQSGALQNKVASKLNFKVQTKDSVSQK